MGTSGTEAALTEKVQRLLQRGKASQALGACRAFLAARQEDYRLRLRLGDTLTAHGLSTEGVRLYEEAEAILQKKEETVKAIAVNKLILRLDPQNKDAQGRLAVLYSRRGLPPDNPPSLHHPVIAPMTRRHRFFDDLGREEYDEVLRNMDVRFVPAGTTIIHEGEVNDSFFIISRGRVKVTIEDLEGNELTLAALGENEFFGEISPVTGHRRTATVTAVEDCELLELSRERLESVMAWFPQIRSLLEAAARERTLDTARQMARRTIERRRNARADFKVPVWCRIHWPSLDPMMAKPLQGLARNLSHEGLSVDLSAPRLIKDDEAFRGRTARVEIALGSERPQMQALAEIRWIETFPGMGEGYYNVGLSFIEVSDSELTKLLSVITERSAAERGPTEEKTSGLFGRLSS